MDQDLFTESKAGAISASATAEFEQASKDTGITRSEILRRIEPWDDQFSLTQFWRIAKEGRPWTLDRFVFVAAALGLDPPMLLDRILRGHDIMGMLKARDGPEDAVTATGDAPEAEEGPGAPGDAGGAISDAPGRGGQKK